MYEEIKELIKQANQLFEDKKLDEACDLSLKVANECLTNSPWSSDEAFGYDVLAYLNKVSQAYIKQLPIKISKLNETMASFLASKKFQTPEDLRNYATYLYNAGLAYRKQSPCNYEKCAELCEKAARYLEEKVVDKDFQTPKDLRNCATYLQNAAVAYGNQTPCNYVKSAELHEKAARHLEEKVVGKTPEDLRNCARYLLKAGLAYENQSSRNYEKSAQNYEAAIKTLLSIAPLTQSDLQSVIGTTIAASASRQSKLDFPKAQTLLREATQFVAKEVAEFKINFGNHPKIYEIYEMLANTYASITIESAWYHQCAQCSRDKADIHARNNFLKLAGQVIAYCSNFMNSTVSELAKDALFFLNHMKESFFAIYKTDVDFQKAYENCITRLQEVQEKFSSLHSVVVRDSSFALAVVCKLEKMQVEITESKEEARQLREQIQQLRAAMETEKDSLKRKERPDDSKNSEDAGTESAAKKQRLTLFGQVQKDQPSATDSQTEQKASLQHSVS